MSMTQTFNAAALAGRAVVLDIETTGLHAATGDRIVEIAMVEMLNGKPTGIEFRALVNPGRDIPDRVVAIHGIDNKTVENEKPFSAIAATVRDFIGDAPVIITCRTKDGVTLDIDFVNAELSAAGVAAVPDGQWINVRRWSELMFGNDKATLDAVLDHYGVSRAERQLHSAIIDARLLAEVLPRLLHDYLRFDRAAPAAKPPSP